MTFEQIITDIHNKKYAPVYFLMGEEPYFIDMISDTWTSTRWLPMPRVSQ